MRVNWFSPLPPQRSDIAHYTARIAPELQRHFEVVYWSTATAPPTSLPPEARVQLYDPDDLSGSSVRKALLDGINIYHIGNDTRFHGAIHKVSARIPGIVVLHDTRLHHFIRYFHENATYIEQARLYYGDEGATYAEEILNGARTIEDHADSMPFTPAVLANAIGAICHSKSAALHVGECSNVPVLELALPFRSLAAPPRLDRRWAPPYNLIMFGFIGTNRRLLEILHALAAFRLKDKLRLSLCGVLWDEALVRSTIDDLGLQDLVRVHGYVPEPDLDAAIASSHLAFNLRHPTMGETSGGLLRSWNLATPTLVTNCGSYTELPDSIVEKISIETEQEDILASLEHLFHDPRHFARQGEAARRYAHAHHGPAAYAAALKNALEDADQLAVRHSAERLIRAVAEHVPRIEERKILLTHAATRIPSLFAQ